MLKGKKKARHFNKTVIVECFFLFKVYALADFQDTNICIYLLNNKDDHIKRKFISKSPDDIALCSIVKAELFFGARHSTRVERNLRRLQLFFQPLASLPFDDRCAKEYGLIRSILTGQGTIIGPNDLLIAATARAYDATLVTNSTKELSFNSPGLKHFQVAADI